DWPGVRAKYEPLLERVADRSDLGDVLHEMAGELSALHIYVGFGDLREAPQNIQPASLGARLSRDKTAGGWRVDHIFASDPDYPGELSPLARPGVDMREGDVILTIDGRPTVGLTDLRSLLSRKAGRQVLLEVLPAGGVEKRSVIVQPIHPDAAKHLRYSEWEYTRRLETEHLGKGDI